METLTDIVFEKRNKAYGAYVLRKEYRNVLLLSLLLSFFLLASAFAYPILASYKSRAVVTHEKTDIIVTIDNSVKPEIPKPPVEEPALPDLRMKLRPPVVVEGNVESGLITQEELGNHSNTEVPASVTEEGPAATTPPPKVIETPAEQPPLVFVPEMPVFTGGEAEMYKFLAANLRYPQEARELGIQGRVYIEFIVEADGSISHVTVKRGIGSGCDEEAARVVSSMPKWNAGKQNGQAVRVLLTLPVKFVLN
jgi:periplasmic protein TonB